MTAKEQLAHAIDELTETAETLDYLARRHHRDALTVFLDQAPLDDEPVTEEEERAVQEAETRRARRELKRLEPAIQRRILAAVESLLDDLPRTTSNTAGPALGAAPVLHSPDADAAQASLRDRDSRVGACAGSAARTLGRSQAG